MVVRSNSGGGRQRRLLTALALGAGAVVSADRLIDRVWASEDLSGQPRRAEDLPHTPPPSLG